jgi:hypothetical protein
MASQRHWPHAQPDVHQFFCGGDWEMSSIFKVNVGVGVDLSGRGPGVVFEEPL